MTEFTHTTNPFGGLIITPDALPNSREDFQRLLVSSLASWRSQGYKVVWLELALDKAALVPIAVDYGFVYHHTTDDYLMLTLQLVERAFVPPYASHYIGAGGVVLNDSDELLVVHEKGRVGQGRYYKLPGGALHVGEHLVEGVVREVLEETGIESRFMSLACLRNMHGYRYGRSDIYFVCRLEPLSFEITKQDEEIEECLWMPVEEYYQADTVSFFNKLIVRAALESPGVVPTEIAGYRDPDTVEVFLPSGTAQIF
jgi:8-oxo-dGTP pyrophosphatase MutT (NUDIX family)